MFKNIDLHREITPEEREIAVNIEKVLVGYLKGDNPFQKVIEDKNSRTNSNK